MKEPLLATKESDVLVVVVHLAFRPFLAILGKLNSKEKLGKSSSSITVLKTNLKKLS